MAIDKSLKGLNTYAIPKKGWIDKNGWPDDSISGGYRIELSGKLNKVNTSYNYEFNALKQLLDNMNLIRSDSSGNYCSTVDRSECVTHVNANIEPWSLSKIKEEIDNLTSCSCHARTQTVCNCESRTSEPRCNCNYRSNICNCESRSPISDCTCENNYTCSCQSNIECSCNERFSWTCTGRARGCYLPSVPSYSCWTKCACNSEGGCCSCHGMGSCPCNTNITYDCSCNNVQACTCFYRTGAATCNCDNRTGPCDCQNRTTINVCYCDNRCSCNTVKEFS